MKGRAKLACFYLHSTDIATHDIAVSFVGWSVTWMLLYCVIAVGWIDCHLVQGSASASALLLLTRWKLTDREQCHTSKLRVGVQQVVVNSARFYSTALRLPSCKCICSAQILPNLFPLLNILLILQCK